MFFSTRRRNAFIVTSSCKSLNLAEAPLFEGQSFDIIKWLNAFRANFMIFTEVYLIYFKTVSAFFPHTQFELNYIEYIFLKNRTKFDKAWQKASCTSWRERARRPIFWHVQQCSTVLLIKTNFNTSCKGGSYRKARLNLSERHLIS